MSALTPRHAARLQALHYLARTALRFCPPLRAKAIVDGAAQWLPPLRDASDARAAVRLLFPRGSCLTRAVTIAAMLPAAEVVIGIAPPRTPRARAHAWLEIGGEPVDTVPGESLGFPDELARLSPVPSGSGRGRMKRIAGAGDALRRES